MARFHSENIRNMLLCIVSTAVVLMTINQAFIFFSLFLVYFALVDVSLIL